jgi:TM2 domain-containing membrane protein YozV
MSDANKMMMYDASKKSVGIAYLLWFFFGGFGAHRFYLSRTGTGVTILLLTLFSILLMFFGVGFLTIWIPAIWVLIDVFLIPGMARRHNMELANRIGMATE